MICAGLSHRPSTHHRPPPTQSFEALNARAVSVVIDPIQSVRGKVVIDAFRCISPQVRAPRTLEKGTLNVLR
jgi:hypothetical protein